VDLRRRRSSTGSRLGNLSVEVIANSGHQVIDEQPATIAYLLERYAAR
jgi:hypothetical protein